MSVNRQLLRVTSKLKIPLSPTVSMSPPVSQSTFPLTSPLFLHVCLTCFSLHTCVSLPAGFSLGQQQIEDCEEWLHHKQRSHSPHRQAINAVQTAGQTKHPAYQGALSWLKWLNDWWSIRINRQTMWHLPLSVCLDEHHNSSCVLWLQPLLQTRGGKKKKRKSSTRVSITWISITHCTSWFDFSSCSFFHHLFSCSHISHSASSFVYPSTTYISTHPRLPPSPPSITSYSLTNYVPDVSSISSSSYYPPFLSATTATRQRHLKQQRKPEETSLWQHSL